MKKTLIACEVMVMPAPPQVDDGKHKRNITEQDLQKAFPFDNTLYTIRTSLPSHMLICLMQTCEYPTH